MYSPKITEELIPQLYQCAKEQGVPMTRLVDRIIREALAAPAYCEARPGVEQAPCRQTVDRTAA